MLGFAKLGAHVTSRAPQPRPVPGLTRVLKCCHSDSKVIRYGLIAGLAVVVVARGQTTIISDTFSGTGGATLNGRTPDGVNLPGRTFSSASYLSGLGADQTIDSGAGSPAPSALTGFNGSVTYNLASNGGYVKPSLLTLSLDLQINTALDSLPDSLRGVGLGFYSAPRVNNSEIEAFVNFTGLNVSPGGALVLVIAGVRQAATTVAAFPGFSTDNFYNLTYSLDTSTGSITSVSFNGNDYTSAFNGGTTAGVFTSTLTNLFGFYGATAESTSLTSRVDNLSISIPSAIPEPGASALLLGLAMGFVFVLRRRTART